MSISFRMRNYSNPGLQLMFCATPHIKERVHRIKRKLGLKRAVVSFHHDLAHANSEASKRTHTRESYIFHSLSEFLPSSQHERFVNDNHLGYKCLARIEVVDRTTGLPKQARLYVNERTGEPKEIVAYINVGSSVEEMSQELRDRIIFLYNLLRPLCTRVRNSDRLWRVFTNSEAFRFQWINTKYRSSLN